MSRCSAIWRPDAPGRYPAVIVLHGCGGFGSYYPVAADVLKSYGYVALALDSLDEINACTGGSGDVAESFDAYAALAWLARQNFVDADRVALLGFSLGGNATLDDVETGSGAIEKIAKRHFRTAVAYYPYCLGRVGGHERADADPDRRQGRLDPHLLLPGHDGAAKRQRRSGETGRLSRGDARVQLSSPGAAISRPSLRL